MDPTTLVTFLFRAPPGARTVELLGSWDNFSQPYRMHNDVRRGAGFWSGCFKFHNIIFDGDKSSWTKPRTGGLKQGGTYWYYYRLDDSIEAYDDSRECTASCPLLPGQTMNIIEVPSELEERPARSRSASVDVVGTLTRLTSVHTLDPRDKFAALDPPPISKVHERCVSDLALNRPPESNEESESEPIALFARAGQPARSFTYPAAERPSGRYYANGPYVDDRSSIGSGHSWHSASPSFAHSAVVNAFTVESPADSETRLEPTVFPGISRPSTRSRLDSPYNAVDRFDSYLEFELMAARNGGEFERFDLGSIPYRPAHSSSQAASNERDFCSNYAPASPRPVTQPASRPKTSHGALEPYTTLFSHRHTIQRSHTSGELRCVTLAPPLRPPPPPPVAEDNLPASPAQSASEPEDLDSLDVCSPTFSADTVSSNGGLNTPFRLSFSQFTSHPNIGSDSIESVAERLRYLGALEDRETAFPPPTILEEVDESSPPMMPFTGYALPPLHDVAAESTLSLGKCSSGHASTIGPISAIVDHDRPEVQEFSFAESIFSELSYLGTSIA